MDVRIVSISLLICDKNAFAAERPSMSVMYGSSVARMATLKVVRRSKSLFFRCPISCRIMASNSFLSSICVSFFVTIISPFRVV